MNVTNTTSEQIYKKHNLWYKNSNFSTNALYRCFPGLASSTTDAFQGQQLHLSEPPLQMQPRAHLAQPGGQQGQQPEKVTGQTGEFGGHAPVFPLPLPPLRESRACHRLLSTLAEDLPTWGRKLWDVRARGVLRSHQEYATCPERGRGLLKVIGQWQIKTKTQSS